MTFPDLWSTLSGSIRAVKTLLGLYVLFYVVPAGGILYLIVRVTSQAFPETCETNLAAVILLGVLVLLLLGWTAWVFSYFTRQRTKNPHLYERGFVSDLTVGVPDGEKNDR